MKKNLFPLNCQRLLKNYVTGNECLEVEQNGYIHYPYHRGRLCCMDPWEATNANSPILILHLPWCKGAAAAQGAQGVKPTLKLICMRPGSPRLVPNPEQ